MAGKSTHLDVLLVEDNPGDARLVEHHLDSPAVTHFVDDVSISHVESLDAAADSLTADDWDVLLLDLGLQHSSGLETLTRANDVVDDVPIIVLTGLNDREAAVQAIEEGAQDYLPKDDLDGDRLVRALRYAVVRNRQERKLHQKTEQLEFFNSILRHDLLNGMNVIQGRAEMLEAELDDDRKDHAATVVDWSQSIIELSEKVRSTLDAVTADESVQLEPVALRPLIVQEADRVRGMSESVDISLDCEPGVYVEADDLLADVVGNVLTNAVDHTDGPVSITVDVTVQTHTVTLRIADDGEGIDPDRRDSVFERGQQGHQSTGSGFGLYFVDAMVSSYGGSVSVDESESGGTAFDIVLQSA